MFGTRGVMSLRLQRSRGEAVGPRQNVAVILSGVLRGA